MVGLVTGANRGLGYELIKRGLEIGHDMIAACRSLPQPGSNLKYLEDVYKERLTIVVMDITEEEQVSAAAKAVSEKYKSIDLIINNAGVLFESKFDEEDVISNMDIAMFRKTMDVNVTGNAIVLKYFIGLLYCSGSPCIINITSEAGNLESGGYHYLAYSVSKYAANMYTQKIKNYLDDKKPQSDICIFMLHPGRMQTLMGVENAQIQPEESALGIWNVIENRKNIKMEVPFINYKGEPMKAK